MQINCSTGISISRSFNLEARSGFKQLTEYKLNNNVFTVVEMVYKFVLVGLLGQLVLVSCVALFLIFFCYVLCGQSPEDATHTEFEMNTPGSRPGPVSPASDNPGLETPQNKQQRNVTFPSTIQA